MPWTLILAEKNDEGKVGAQEKQDRKAGCKGWVSIITNRKIGLVA